MIITFPYWGNYTIAFSALFEKLGLKVIIPEKSTADSNKKGAMLSPEMYCFPLKANIGNYLRAIEKGADTIFMVTSMGGSCRLRYYAEVQKKVLEDSGKNVDFIIFDQKLRDVYRKLKKIPGVFSFKIFSAIYFFFEKLALIEYLEERANYIRPREEKKNETTKAFRLGLKKVEEAKNIKDLYCVSRFIRREFSKIKFDKKRKIPKVGIIGEIYTVTDDSINYNIEEKLGKEGIESHKGMTLSYHIKKRMFPWRSGRLIKNAKGYLGSAVGGHGLDAVSEMLDFVKKDFDGIVQVLPFGCFLKDTKITAENYIQKSIQDINVGEKILTHKGKFGKVTKTYCRNYKGKILKIDCGGKLLTLSLTPEHPILLAKKFVKNHKEKIEKLDFISAGEAKAGDFIAIPIPKEINEKDSFVWDKEYKRNPKWEDIREFSYSPDLLRMLGYWLAEGSINYDRESGKKYERGLRFSFPTKEKKYIDDVASIIRNNFKTKISRYCYPAKAACSDLYIGNRNLAGIVHSLCGEHCNGKVLHQDLVSLNPNSQREILKGYFRGDGSVRDVYGETTYRTVTTSQNLAGQLFRLLVRSRIKPSLMEQKIKNRKVSYMLKIANAGGIKRLGDELIKTTERKDYVRFRETEDYFLVPIRKIEEVDFKGEVYNLEVEKDHSYVANFLAVHNCMPEVTVRPILEKIHRESGIPFLSLSLDEQVAEAGVDTRIEAFVDVVKNHYKNKLIKKI